MSETRTREEWAVCLPSGRHGQGRYELDRYDSREGAEEHITGVLRPEFRGVAWIERIITTETRERISGTPTEEGGQ